MPESGVCAKEGACFGLTVLDPRVQGRAAAGRVTVQSQEWRSPRTSVPGPIHCWWLWSCPESLGTLGVHQHEDTRLHPTCRARVPVRSPAPVSVVFPDSGISAYATILQRS